MKHYERKVIQLKVMLQCASKKESKRTTGEIKKVLSNILTSIILLYCWMMNQPGSSLNPSATTTFLISSIFSAGGRRRSSACVFDYSNDNLWFVLALETHMLETGRGLGRLPDVIALINQFREVVHTMLVKAVILHVIIVII